MDRSRHTPTEPVERDRMRRIVRRSPVFADALASSVDALVAEGHLVAAERRRPLVMREPGLFVVGTGRVRLLRRTGDRDLTLDYVGPGDVLGETLLVDPTSPFDTVCTEHVEAVWLPLPLVQRFVSEDSGFCKALGRLMGERRLVAEQRIHSLLTRSVESRVAEFLQYATRRHGIPDSRGKLIGVKFTHQEIASYVGSTRETVTLVLGDFKRQGLIATDHRRLVVIDEDALATRV